MFKKNLQHQIHIENENEVTKKIVEATDDSVWNETYDLTVINSLVINLDLQEALDIDSLT